MKPESYLTDSGKRIFTKIEKYLKEKGITHNITSLELSMLANSFDVYATAALDVNENGYKQLNERTGGYSLSPAAQVMKTEYTNIKNHSPKFGINPVDMRKILADDSPKSEDPLSKLMNGK